MTAKGGKSIEITTHNDRQRRFLDLDEELLDMFDETKSPIGYVNIQPRPSALDSIWQALWTWLKNAW